MLGNFCKQNGCESNPDNCGYNPQSCIIISLRRSLDDLIYICESYNVADDAPDDVQKDIDKAIAIAKFAEEIK